MQIGSSISSTNSSVQLALARQRVASAEAEVRNLETQLQDGRVRLERNQNEVSSLQKQDQALTQTEGAQVKQDVVDQVSYRAQPEQVTYPPVQPAVSSSIAKLGSIINTLA